MSDHDKPRSPTLDDVNATPSPARAFSQGVGFIMQSVGATLVLIMTCGCCVITFLDSGRLHEMGTDSLTAYSDVPGAYLALMAVAGVGGFCLMGFGIGQQADRGQRPAIANAFTTTVCMVISGIALATLIRSDEPTGVIVFGLILVVLMTVLTCLAWPAVAAVLRDPLPWDGPPTVPAEEYPDPWADTTKRMKRAQAKREGAPTKAELEQRRQKLLDELASLEELAQETDEKGTTGPGEAEKS